jgi:hypothetical protein
VVLNEDSQRAILSVVRLGDLDHRGWWRSHGLDETGSFLLGRSFKRTWAATAMELSMISARARHVHSWLLEQKLQDDLKPFEFFRTVTTEELLGRLPDGLHPERRASGLYLGTLTKDQVQDPDYLEGVLGHLLGAYRALGAEFLAPYLDLVK